jgi:hypothetical protein
MNRAGEVMRLLLALPLALALTTGAFAKDRDKGLDRVVTVETLKSKLPDSKGFEVQDVRAGESGFACVTYRVGNAREGRAHTRALVKGDQVLRENNRYIDFEKAWNRKCAGR